MVPICLDGIKKGLYYIEEDGRIWSNYKKDYLIPQKDKDGYLNLILSGEGAKKKKCCRIATLVALVFLGKPPQGMLDPTINHIDGNILNNHYSNLEWMERGKNSSIRKNKGQGTANHEAKLNENQVHEICDLLVNSNLTLEEIGKRYNVDKSTISNIYRKKNWKNITKEYDFSCRITIRNSKGQFQVINTKNLNKENWNFGSSGQ